MPLPQIAFIIAMLIVGLVAGILMMKNMKPPVTEDKSLEIPNTEIGKPIGVLFGTRLIKSPHIAWYGDVAIRKVKVSPKGKK